MNDPLDLAELHTDQPGAMRTVKADSPASDPRAVDLALRRYDIVFRYLATENQLSWTKSQFFLAANAGLLAFGASRFPKDTVWYSLIVPSLIAFIGLFLSLLWLSTLSRASKHVDWWKGICKTLEPAAFGSHRILRDAPQTGMRRIKHSIAGVFLAIWSVALAALAIAFMRH